MTTDEESDSSSISKPCGMDIIENLETYDQIYLFYCPSNFNPKSLLNLDLDLNEPIDIKDVSGEKFRIKSSKPVKRQINLVAELARKTKLATLDISGIIQAERKLEINKAKDPVDVDDAVPFPTNLRLRHPLLGVLKEKSKTLDRSKRLKKSKLH